MDKRIEEELKGRTPEEVDELNLDNCEVTQIEGLTDEFINLETLSMINCGLASLKGFPSLPSLRKLDLSDNKLNETLNYLHGCPKLSYLSLSGNKIKDIASLEPLKKLKCLRKLDLLNCAVADTPGYREQTFELLEGLLYLDGFDRDNEEADEDEEDGDLDDEDDDDEEGLDDEEDVDEEGVPEDDDDEGDEDSEGEGFGEEDEDDEDEEGAARGTKRKHADEEEPDEDA